MQAHEQPEKLAIPFWRPGTYLLLALMLTAAAFGALPDVEAVALGESVCAVLHRVLPGVLGVSFAACPAVRDLAGGNRAVGSGPVGAEG